MAITLIGYRGCGKSTVGELLAARLGWEFVDADAVIEQRAGKTIREIFEDSGEPEFRRIERDVMSELLQRAELVIAAGGGADGSANRNCNAGFRSGRLVERRRRYADEADRIGPRQRTSPAESHFIRRSSGSRTTASGKETDLRPMQFAERRCKSVVAGRNHRANSVGRPDAAACAGRTGVVIIDCQNGKSGATACGGHTQFPTQP